MSPEEKLKHPLAGTAIDQAREFGIDLSLLIERLRLTPDERVRQLQKTMIELEQIRGAAQNGLKRG
jgi:hypothetical protein